jgi:hypothetical protein
MKYSIRSLTWTPRFFRSTGAEPKPSHTALTLTRIGSWRHNRTVGDSTSSRKVDPRRHERTGRRQIE